ncbi:MAG: decarboxylase [Firmicutes bacterium]|nr:decarboxylase [Bacillota bacterium]
MKTSIREFLINHGAQRPVSFHMPGHKGKDFYVENGYGDFLDAIMDCDITEIPGADNLFQAEDVILEVMEKYRSLYGTEKSYLLINGSSGGILASVLASVPKGGKLVMARNCHKSVFNALSLGDITPIYAFPDAVDGYGILGEVKPWEIARCLDENPDADAVILPSPNYYGICSDIKAIAHEVHKRGKILIVDQAHGAHLKFFKHEGFPEAAEDLGADIVINSIHKTLGSFTQTAILNVCSGRVDLAALEDKLQTVESSSPSYPLMATLDINADILQQKGTALMQGWAEDLKWFYRAASEIEGLSLMKTDNLDPTKLNIDMSAYGFNGSQLEEYLMERGIFIELVAGNVVMCMTGIGNK